MKRKIKYIVIHCTATPQNTTLESIQRYWRENLGWKSPGYHRLIEADGTVHKLAEFEAITNGVRGFNKESIHISYIGGKDRDDRTEAQKAAILDCIFEAKKWVDEKVIIQGHRDFPNVPKLCPNFDAKKEFEWINV